MRPFLAFVMILCGTVVALAHPHVFVTAKSAIVYDATGAVTGVRHAWTFDDMFSSFAIQGLDKNNDGILTREELAPLAKINVESLKEFDYFTIGKLSGKKLLFKEPVDYWLDYTNNALTLHFTLPLNAPQILGTRAFALEVYDPTYYVAFDMVEKDPVTLVDAPPGCAFDLRRPGGPDPALAQKLSVDAFAMQQTGIGEQFANRILVNCP